MYKYNIFYQTQNFINGKYYYGVHSTNNLNDNYLGSGKNIKNSIKKYGRENFYREILCFFPDRKSAFEYEEKFLNEQILSDPQCYNISKGGNKGGDTSGLVNVIDPSSGNRFMVSMDDPRYISGDLISVLKGYISVKDEAGKIFRFRTDDEEYAKGNFRLIGIKPYGKNKTLSKRKLSEEHKDKIRRSREGANHRKETIEKIRNSSMGHTRQAGKSHSQFGKKWMKNMETGESKLIDQDSIGNFLTLGWVFGRNINNK